MADLLADVARRGNPYLQGLNERPVAPAQQSLDNLAIFDEPLPENPTVPKR